MGSSPSRPWAGKPLSCTFVEADSGKPRYRIKVAGKVITMGYVVPHGAMRNEDVKRTAPRRARSRRAGE